MQALCAKAGVALADVDNLLHGTTVATNIVLTHSGAEAGMITTHGFRDIVHIARHKKPFNFSLQQELPWQSRPLVKRRHRLTVKERVTVPDGDVLVELDDDEVRERVRALKQAGVESVAVCLLHSYLNPAHERRIKEIVLEEFPEAYLSVSHEVLPLYREFERFSTVALNAYVGPKVSRYVTRFDEALREIGFTREVQLMQSSGGMATVEAARERPVNLLMSGPVAGLVGGIWAGRMAGHENVVTLDMGGTSADIGVAAGGQLRVRHLLDTKVGDYQAMVPMVDIDTIGAGGGSIAYVDAGGVFRVGPQSAGADPGPACYGRGGDQPTSTDAQLLLGRLRPDRGLLGGDMSLDVELATRGDASASPTGSASRSRRRRSARSRSRSSRWRRRSRSTRCAAGTTRGSSRSSRPAARARCSRATSRSSSRSRASWCPRIRGSRRRPGCSRPTSSTSSSPRSATSCARSTATASAPAWTSSLRRRSRSSSATASRRTGASCGASPTAATSDRATRSASTSPRASSTTAGRTGSRTRSTPPTSASTGTGSMRRSRSSTSARSGSG